MIREIIKPTDSTYILKLPDEMIGKLVEVIAFEIEDMANISDTPTSIDDIQKKYSKYPPVSHEYYKFDRDEAQF